jgi:hypothetical protein
MESFHPEISSYNEGQLRDNCLKEWNAYGNFLRFTTISSSDDSSEDVSRTDSHTA